MKAIFSKLRFSILKNHTNFKMIYHFYQKEWKLKKVEKLVTNLHDRTEYFIHIRNLKHALNHGLIFKNIQRVSKFNQNAWLKPYIHMNTKLSKNAKSDVEKDFSKLMNNPFFAKIMENVRKHIKYQTCNNRKEKKLFSIRTKF